MAKGIVLCQGDRTTCGGKIIAGSAHGVSFNKRQAREGDPVTCGKWNQTGISDIEGYATHIERSAKYVKAMRYTGYLGIGFSGLHSLNEIHEACSVGRETECTKKKYTEIGSFALGTGGGIYASGFAIPLCVAIGAGTAGVGGLVCTVIASVGLGYAGSIVGNAVGELSGVQLYDVFGN